MADRPRPKGSKGGRGAGSGRPDADRVARGRSGPSGGSRPQRRRSGAVRVRPGSRPEGSATARRVAARALGRPGHAPDGPGGGPPAGLASARTRPVATGRTATRRAGPRSRARPAPVDPGDRRPRAGATRPTAAATPPDRGPSPVRWPADAAADRDRRDDDPGGQRPYPPRDRRGPPRAVDRPAPGRRAPLRPTDRRPFRGGRAGPRPWARRRSTRRSWPRPAAARYRAPDLLGPDEELVAGRRPVEEVFAAGRTAHRLLVVPQRRQRPRAARPPRHAPAHPDRRGRGRLADRARRVRRPPGRRARRRAAPVRHARRRPRPSRRARRAAVRARPRFARGSAERGHAPAQRGGGRRPRRRLPDPAPGAAQPGRGEGVGRAPSSTSCSARSTTCRARSPTCTATACGSPAPRRTRR